jgi:spore coat protein U-like protein
MAPVSTTADEQSEPRTKEPIIMKRTIIAITAGLAVTGGVFASAASLGGVTSTNLGSSATVVASCDTDGVSVDYDTAYDAASGTYLLTSVTVDGIDASCKGEKIEVSLKNSDGKASTTTSRAVVTGSSQLLEVDGFAGESVDSAAVLIES